MDCVVEGSDGILCLNADINRLNRATKDLGKIPLPGGFTPCAMSLN